MKAIKELKRCRIKRCKECHCVVEDDWEYKDFSNRTIVVCPQCKTEIELNKFGLQD